MPDGVCLECPRGWSDTTCPACGRDWTAREKWAREVYLGDCPEPEVEGRLHRHFERSPKIFDETDPLSLARKGLIDSDDRAVRVEAYFLFLRHIDAILSEVGGA